MNMVMMMDKDEFDRLCELRIDHYNEYVRTGDINWLLNVEAYDAKINAILNSAG